MFFALIVVTSDPQILIWRLLKNLQVDLGGGGEYICVCIYIYICAYIVYKHTQLVYGVYVYIYIDVRYMHIHYKNKLQSTWFKGSHILGPREYTGSSKGLLQGQALKIP